ncbi:MAG TPA: hypothetical protein PLL20_06190 [Phycisphaerae bacterium]|nr:hypothetical protein [Phycisphaerae bacterium]HRR87009.1 hypothetical protein [Phycisphaerae bacterium]
MRSTTMEWNMMSRTSCVAVALAVLALAGCTCVDGPPADQMNAPPQGTAPTGSRLAENYVAMTDNALLNDASMSSVHFVPRTAELNALGVRRLTRMAEVLKVYGGTVFYDGSDAERDLRKDRVEKIRLYLTSCGIDPSRFKVEEGFAGGSGIDGDEAVAIRRATRGPGDVKIQAQAAGSGSSGGQGGGSQ